MTTHASRNDWISVEDSLPEHDGPVLVFAPSAELPKPFIYVGWYDPDSASASFSLPAGVLDNRSFVCLGR